VNLLSQLVKNSNPSQSPSSVSESPVLGDQSFEPDPVAIRINILLFLSFFLSTMSAVACALIQQWCYEYLKFAYPRAAPHECGRVRTFLFRGLREFQMRRFLYGTHVLLHISLFLFFWALNDFFYTVHIRVGAVTRYCLVPPLVLYAALTISPFIFSNSPYNTPLTPLLRASGILLLYGFRFTLRLLGVSCGRALEFTKRPYIRGIHFDRDQLLLRESEKQAEELEPYAMKWLFTKNDFSDKDMDTFLAGLPGYMSSHHTKRRQLNNYLTDGYILKRIKVHFMTCVTSLELSEEVIITRVWCCVKSLRLIFLIFQHSLDARRHPPDSDQSPPETVKGVQMGYIQEIIDDLNKFCDLGAENSNPMVALRASCVRALAVQGLLSQLAPGEGGATPNRSFTPSLIPLYTFFFPKDNKGIIQRLAKGERVGGEEHKSLWEALLYDGPLANLTVFATAVCSGEDAPSVGFSFCWKALDILLTQLGIARTGVSQSTLSRFNDVREDTRKYVRGEEWGFRVTPLLETLDAVARGLWLSKAFSFHPEYRSRSDLVFRKEKIWNNDLLAAFARCLPDYVAKTAPGECTEYMEGIVRDNDLWTNLQVNLWNARQSDRPTHDKLRIFDDCCTVLDVAFTALEHSSKVDWGAPEFGSLAQHFQLFTAHCFQGAFMGKPTTFRLGIIKARFCKVLLEQFRDDVDREGTIFFQPRWDIASLAKLLCSFGIGGSENAEFWESYISGGSSGAKFTAKARELMDKAMCDGPLLIFCRLGRLATMAVLLDGYRLEAKDIAKVWELLRNIIRNDQRLPLSRASGKVWAELDQLRDQVSDLCRKNSGADGHGDNLQHLLGTIDNVRNLRPTGSEGHSPNDSENAEVKGSSILVPVKPRLSVEEPRSGGSRFSFASESTVDTGGQWVTTPTSEDDFRGAISLEPMSGASIDSRTEVFADPVSNLKRNAHALSSSPAPDTDGSDSPATDVVSIMGRTIERVPSPVNITFPQIGDTGQLRDVLAKSLTRRSLASSSTQLESGSRRNAFAAPTDPTRSSPYTSSDFGDQGQSDIVPNSALDRDGSAI